MGETDEVDDAIEQLNQITDEIKVKYIDELENTDNEKEEKAIEYTVEEIQNIDSFDDVKNIDDSYVETVDEALNYIEELGYNIDPEIVQICKDIETYKNSNENANISDILKNVESECQNEESILSKVGLIEFTYASSKYKITYDLWNATTTAEKVLIAEYPVQALIVKASANKAYEMTDDKFGYNGMGDKSDGFRHGVWNALMVRDLKNRYLAELFATAHESTDTVKLSEKQADGFKLSAHKAMDLHNNEIGRSIVSVYDSIINLSEKDIENKISNKMTGLASGGIYWLHK